MSTGTWDNINEVLKAIEDAEERWEEVDGRMFGCSEDEEDDLQDELDNIQAELDDLRSGLESMVSDAMEAGVVFDDDQDGTIAWALGEG